ncbi:aminopeptidase N isoform X3 [Aethina tumida]|uniref:aminopeptidase N isoform X3 n=1 Tax=Aethina tumida TaxID=116153 RepID=UPI00096B600C|nr:aminopeptidase N isoform X3 [Aethina tumida]
MKMEKILCTFLLCILAVNGYRLPRSVYPENYNLEILSHLGEKDNFGFDGNVAIQTHCVQPADNITLHTKDLTILDKDVTVSDISSNDRQEQKVSKIEFDKKNDFIIIHLEKPLKEDHKYEIKIKFNGTLNDGLAGFYRSSYIDNKTKEKRWVGVTQFEAISARMAFPCFDEPEMKATFDISIGRKEGLTAVSNMPLKETVPVKEKEGWFWDRFDSSVPMSTYLVAFLVSDFEFRSGEPTKDSNVTFKIWARKDAIDQVEFARDIGPKFLEYYEKFFDIKYPLPKQDMVALSDFSAGAMENWGLITYREAYLLFDPKVSSKTSQHSIASVIAHELAHQWFGNLVTMKWWTDLWLNEGFATYMAAVAVDNLFPQWNSLEEEAASDLLSVFSFDSLKSSHPVSVPIGDPKEIDEIFDTISYKKGSSVIRMMMMFLGGEVLRKGVSNYLKEHEYGNAEQDDLWKALTDEAHKQRALPDNLTVKAIMDSWTVQTGYPVVNVIRDYKGKTAKLSQKRFLKDVSPKDQEKSCWWVPITYSTKSVPHFNETVPKHWLSCPLEDTLLEDVAGEDEWVIFNNKIGGIYKVNYDEDNWKLITKALQEEDVNIVDTLNRVQLLSDAGDLAFTGDLKYNIFFDLVKYLEREENYLPWKTALGKISKIDSFLEKKPIYDEFKEYMKQLLTPIYGKVGGFEIIKAKSDLLQLIKLQILITSRSCRFEVENCVSEAKEQFQKWMKNADKENPIATDVRNVVYCTSLKHGGNEEWEFLWKQYQNSNVATEKSSILSALGCTKKEDLLQRYLDWSLDKSSGIRVQDITQVFAAVARNEVGFPLAKKFFYTNLKKIAEILQPNRKIGRYLTSIGNQIDNEEEAAEFKKVIEEHKEELAAAKKNQEQALETIQVNIQWQKKHADEIKNILPKYYKKI